MSIGYTLFTDTIITETLVSEVINSLNIAVDLDAAVSVRYGIEIVELKETIGVIIDILATSGRPYDKWPTSFLENTFNARSCLDFWINKEKLKNPEHSIYRFVLSVVFTLMGKLKCNAVFITHNSEELCLFTTGEVIINNKYGSWDHPDFREALDGTNYQVFDGIPLKYPGV
jgi:hypothetical protein